MSTRYNEIRQGSRLKVIYEPISIHPKHIQDQNCRTWKKLKIH